MVAVCVLELVLYLKAIEKKKTIISKLNKITSKQFQCCIRKICYSKWKSKSSFLQRLWQSSTASPNTMLATTGLWRSRYLSGTKKEESLVSFDYWLLLFATRPKNYNNLSPPWTQLSNHFFNFTDIKVEDNFRDKIT